jgi:hypothetical protein
MYVTFLVFSGLEGIQDHMSDSVLDGISTVCINNRSKDCFRSVHYSRQGIIYMYVHIKNVLADWSRTLIILRSISWSQFSAIYANFRRRNWRFSLN